MCNRTIMDKFSSTSQIRIDLSARWLRTADAIAAGEGRGPTAWAQKPSGWVNLAASRSTVY
jgi:hypothetical protein